MQYHLIEDWMTIEIGRDVENRITVSFSYNPDYIAKIKIMPGYRWSRLQPKSLRGVSND
jgi:hypothetical protein